MQPSAVAASLIKRFEGFSAHVYRCPAGYPTIGYGHAVEDAESFPNPITTDEAERLLLCDMRIAAQAVARLIVVPLTQPQFDALTSFTFNLGAGRLQMSRLRMVINRGEHDAVPKELMRWVYAQGRKLPGLIARRAAEGVVYSAAPRVTSPLGEVTRGAAYPHPSIFM